MAPIKNISRGFIGSFISRIGVGTAIFNRQSLVATAATSSSINIFSPGNAYTYHIFTQPGRFYVSNAGYIDFCVVGGGGAGGSGSSTGFHGGGGGAGGFVEKYNVLCPIGFYDICTGIGGAATSASPSSSDSKRNGTPSFVSGPVGFTSITATGGGQGGCSPGGIGQPGGSGGGGSSPGQSAGNGTGQDLTREGYPGGGGGPIISGSGGGAGGAGRFGNADGGVSGTNGLSVFGGDTGVPPAFGVANPAPLPGRWFAGGGGGVPLGTGGVGGGGNGGPTTGNGADATINTGGGGGGSGGPGNQSGSGAPGIVLIRYRNKTLQF
jgi:hypothetical protein